MRFLIAILFLTVIGCGQEDGKKSKGDITVTQAGIAPVDITNRSSCRGGTPGGLTIFSKAWIVRHLTNTGLTLDREMRIQPTNLEVIVTGTWGPNSSEIHVRSGIREGNRQVEILSADSNEGSVETTNGSLKFSFAIRPMTFRYSFVGPCLKIQTAKADTLILIPRNL